MIMSGFGDFVDVPSGGEAMDGDDVVVDDTVGGVILLPSNPNRKSALVVNLGLGNIRVTTDGSEPTPTHGKPVLSGGVLSLSSPYCPTKEVRACRQETTDTTVNVSEVN